MLARVHRVIRGSEAGLGSDQQDVYAGPKQVWEALHHGYTVDIFCIVGRCKVVSDVDGVGASPNVPTFKGIEFVRRLSNGKFQVVRSPGNRLRVLPWRQEEAEGYLLSTTSTRSAREHFAPSSLLGPR